MGRRYGNVYLLVPLHCCHYKTLLIEPGVGVGERVEEDGDGVLGRVVVQRLQLHLHVVRVVQHREQV